MAPPLDPDPGHSPGWLTPDAPLLTLRGGWEGRVLTADGWIPAGVLDPPAKWIFEIVVPLLGVAVVIFLLYQAIRRRTVSWALLFVLCSASTWWMETFGDWGQQLIYSPDFLHYTWKIPFTMPHNPYFMPAAYAFYWWIQAIGALELAKVFSRRYGWSVGKGILVIAVPVSFVWDFFVEGMATYLGWWTYDPAVGPYLDMGRGNMPLLWPMILMFIWPNLIAWLAHVSESSGLNRMERMFGLSRLAVRGRRFQLARGAAWLATFQASFFLVNVVPLVAVWYFLGYASPWLACHPAGCR